MIRRTLLSILALSLIVGLVFAANARHKSEVEAARRNAQSLAGVVTLPLAASLSVNDGFGVTVKLQDGREVGFPGCHEFALYLRSYSYRVNAEMLSASGNPAQQFTFRASGDPTCAVVSASEESLAGAYIKVTLHEGNRERALRELF